MEWQPIETAPTNGDSILVCDGRTLDGCHQVVFWDDEADDESMWRWSTSDGPTFHRLAFTHWMPLPAPPAGQSGERHGEEKMSENIHPDGKPEWTGQQKQGPHPFPDGTERDIGTASAQDIRELWREREDDYYADSIHVTAGGGIGLDCGGHVITMTIRAWHALPASLRAYVDDNDLLRARVAELEAENAQHLEEISRLQADIISKRGWEVTPDGMRDARVAELEGALRPFAAAAKRFRPYPTKAEGAVVEVSFTLGQIRAAERAVLNAPANAKEVMPNQPEDGRPPDSASLDKSAPRPAQSPAGAAQRPPRRRDDWHYDSQGYCDNPGRGY